MGFWGLEEQGSSSTVVQAKEAKEVRLLSDRTRVHRTRFLFDRTQVHRTRFLFEFYTYVDQVSTSATDDVEIEFSVVDLAFQN